MNLINIALDGPSGVGKSSAADLLAERFGLTHIDTGAMYRAISLYLHENGIPAQNGPELENALQSPKIDMKGKTVFLNGEDVSKKIREPQVSMLASSYSALPAVRKKLVALQQQMAADKGYILDGRDICDVVLPDAEVKIYLDASAKARANRRWLQDQQKGINIDYQQVLREIEERDEQDRTRKESPLRVSQDAVQIDSSDLNLEQTVDKMAEVIEAVLQKGSV